jgi:heat-inducible transcriptional repressor
MVGETFSESMPVKISLNHRQQQVLQATVRHYIATAEPVGSNVLVREYNMSVSSATIRNAMSMLEREGLLYQPHTSAGRVPSDSGYRLYVDHLMPPAASQRATQTLTDRLGLGNWNLEAILHGAAQILATLSGYITLVTLPIKQPAEVRHVQLVQVDAHQVMLIVVTDTYETQSVLVPLPAEEPETADPELRDRELQVLSNFLNEALRGQSLGAVMNLDWSALGQEFDRYSHLMSTMLQALARRFAPINMPSQLMISGVAEVLRQPEFSELSQLQNLLSLLESQQDQLLPIFGEQLGQLGNELGRRVNVLIGAENPLEPMRSCSLVSATYTRGSQAVGSIGVLGPTRMEYASTIALVEATADYLSDVIG